MLVFNRQHRLFLGERHGEPGVWQFPQGGVEPGCSLEENVLRELEEELGLAPSALQIITKLKSTQQYDFRVVPEYAKGVWRGQSQSFWLVQFLGSDKDIVLDKHQPEFMSFKWCTINEVRRLAEPHRLRGYEGALKEFEQFLKSASR